MSLHAIFANIAKQVKRLSNIMLLVFTRVILKWYLLLSGQRAYKYMSERFLSLRHKAIAYLY